MKKSFKVLQSCYERLHQDSALKMYLAHAVVSKRIDYNVHNANTQ